MSDPYGTMIPENNEREKQTMTAYTLTIKTATDKVTESCLAHDLMEAVESLLDFCEIAQSEVKSITVDKAVA